MTDYMAQMLNELMGSQRDAMPGERRELRYDDPNVCTDFLVGFCTHEIFRNTKNDLGFCKYNIHDENLKNSYRSDQRKGQMGFEKRFLERIRRIHEDVRRKIQKHEDRLAVTQGESRSAEETFGTRIQEIEQRKEQLTKKMEDLVNEAGVEGEKGNVEAAQVAMEKADKAKFEIDELTFESNNLMNEKEHAINMEENVTAGNRQMQVCQICGCFMLQNDAPQRVDDHLTGKLHIAYQLISDTIQTLELEIKEQNDKRMEERFSRRYNRSRSRERKPEKSEKAEKTPEKTLEKSEKPEKSAEKPERSDRSDRSEHRRDRDRDHREHRDHRDNRDNRDHQRHRDREDRGHRAHREGGRDRGHHRADRDRSDRDRDRRRNH